MFPSLLKHEERTQMIEELYPIKDYEGRYSITKSGKVWSHPRGTGRGIVKNGKFMSPALCGNSYFGVALYIDHKLKWKSIHRLLAETFIPNPENKAQVNHINGITTDNRLENLEWTTIKENNNHAIRIGLINKQRKLTMEQAEEIRKKYIKVKYGLQKLALEYGVDSKCVWKIIKNRNYMVQIGV